MCISQAVGPGATNRFEDVKALQILLNLNQTRFPAIAPLSEDGRWGSSTQLDIEAFQRTAMGNSSPDGRVDPGGVTLAALRAGLSPDFSEAKLRGIMPRARDTDIAGNTHSGDGEKFKGRGLIQLTGRANYVAYGLDKGRNFTDGANPSLIATDVTLAIDVA